MTDTRRFDQAAITWDGEDRRVRLALDVAEAIARRVPLEPAWEGLDFGCGTGLVTLALAGRLAKVTGADTSPGMLEVLAGKAEAQGVPLGIRTLDPAHLDLGGPYDLIFSSMTLHHVADLRGLFAAFAHSLRPGGWVALADLEAEDGSFHSPEVEDVHHLGFHPGELQAWLQAAGFGSVRVAREVTTLKGGRAYPILLATGKWDLADGPFNPRGSAHAQ